MLACSAVRHFLVHIPHSSVRSQVPVFRAPDQLFRTEPRVAEKCGDLAPSLSLGRETALPSPARNLNVIA